MGLETTNIPGVFLNNSFKVITSAKEVMSLFVCLCPGLRKNYWTDFQEILQRAGANPRTHILTFGKYLIEGVGLGFSFFTIFSRNIACVSSPFIQHEGTVHVSAHRPLWRPLTADLTAWWLLVAGQPGTLRRIWQDIHTLSHMLPLEGGANFGPLSFIQDPNVRIVPKHKSSHLRGCDQGIFSVSDLGFF